MVTSASAARPRVSETNPNISDKVINERILRTTSKANRMQFFYSEVFSTLSNELPTSVTKANIEEHRKLISWAWTNLKVLSKWTIQVAHEANAIDKVLPSVEFGSKMSKQIAQTRLVQIKEAYELAISQQVRLLNTLVDLNRSKGDDAAPLLIGKSIQPKKPVKPQAAPKDVAGTIAKVSGALLCRLPMELGFLMATLPSALIRRGDSFFNNYPSIGKLVVPPLEVVENSPYTTPLLGAGFALWATYKMTPQWLKTSVYNGINHTYDQVTVQWPTAAKKTYNYCTNWRNWCCLGAEPKASSRRSNVTDKEMSAAALARAFAAAPPAVVIEVTDAAPDAAPAAAAAAPDAAKPQPAPTLRSRVEPIINGCKKVAETTGKVAESIFSHRKSIGCVAVAGLTALAAHYGLNAGLNHLNAINFQSLATNLPVMKALNNNMGFPNVSIL